MSQLTEILRGDSSSGKNSKSLIARLGQLGQKYTDPLAWIFGRDYTDKLVDIADWSNKQFSSVAKRDPFIKLDRKYNPLQQYEPFQKAAEWTVSKPADTAAIAAGAYFGGGALGSAFGGGSGGGGGGGGSGSGGLFNMNWQNPQTYTRFAGMGGNSNGNAANQNAILIEQQRRQREREEERRRKFEEEQRRVELEHQLAQMRQVASSRQA